MRVRVDVVRTEEAEMRGCTTQERVYSAEWAGTCQGTVHVTF